MINKKQMQKWVKALRSGKFKKGKGCLKQLISLESPKNYQYCCLGVAEEIGLGAYSGRNEVLKEDFLPLSIQMKLAERNDGKDSMGRDIPKWSFKRIADYIEKNFEKWKSEE